MVTIGQEIAALLDPDAAAALRMSADLNGITLRYAGWTDHGYTAARLISVYAGEVGMPDRKLVLKATPGGRDTTAEPRRHREALAESSPEFRAAHLVEQPWAAIPVPGGGWIMFQEIASGSLGDIQPLSAILADPMRTDDTAAACATVVRSLLADWNPAVTTTDPFPTPSAYLRGLLGHRIDLGGTVRTWADMKGLIPPDGPPNPFALVLDNSLTENRQMYVRLGKVHGDLHPGNILVPRDPAGYRLIDLSRFGAGRPLAFDPAYLALTIAVRYLPDLSPPQRRALAEFLVAPPAGRPAGLPAAIHAVVGAVTDTAGAWGARNGLGDEWRQEFLLSLLGCALIMTGRAIIPAAGRDWCYELARLATAHYLDLPTPAEPPRAPRPAVPVSAPPDVVETTVLPLGTRLWRVHPRSASPAEFVADPTGRRSVLYASRRAVTALVDGVLPGVHFGPDGERVLTPQRLRGMRLSAVRTTRDLVLACADGEPDLVALWPPAGVHGVEWPSAGDLPEPALVLLADRCPAGALRPADEAIDLDDPERVGWLRESLRPYRVRMSE